MSIGGIFGDGIATPISGCGVNCSSTGYYENTGGNLGTSYLAGAEEVADVRLLIVIDAVVRPTAGIGVKPLDYTGKKLWQSS